MISSKINLFYTFFINFPYQTLLFFFSILFLFLANKAKKIKISIRHKINNFFLNWIYIIIYFFYYIFLSIIIRYGTWGYSFNFFVKIQDLKNFFFTKPLHFFFLFSLFLLLYILLHKARLVLSREIRKKHLYSFYFYRVKEIKEHYRHLYPTFIKYFTWKLSYDRVENFLFTYLSRFYKKLLKFFISL